MTKLPRLPSQVVLLGSKGYTPKQMREYALKAIETYKQENQNEKVSNPSVIVEHGWLLVDKQHSRTGHG
jgi:hypothetical protein